MLSTGSALHYIAYRVRKQRQPQQQEQVVDQESREDIKDGDWISTERSVSVTPEFECNIAGEDENLILSAEDSMRSNNFEDDFQRHSISSDEKQMPNVPPWLREAVK